MRIYRNDNTDPALNLALEEWLVSHTEDDCFMLWQNKPAIIIGRNQNAHAEINKEFVHAHHLPVVRRLSGGGAVYHDLGNLNFTFISHNTEKRFDFRHFAQPVVDALQQLGVRAEYSGRNDLVIEGRKFSGNAQYIQGHKVLHHGTLLFDSDLTVLQQALNVDPRKYESKGVKSVASRVTNIAPHLPRPLTIREFRDCLVAYIQHSFAGAVLTDFSADDIAGANSLVKSRYGNNDWNYGRLAPYHFRNTLTYPGGHVECRLTVTDGTISGVSIYGDFFGVRTVAELEQRLSGIRHEYDAVRRVLATVDLAEYFAGLDDGDAIIRLLV